MNKGGLTAALQDYFDILDTADLITLWNQYVSEANRMDDYIYSMDAFDEMHEGMKPWDIVRAAYYSGHFCPADDWYWYNGYGNLVSSDWPEHEDASPYYLNEIIHYTSAGPTAWTRRKKTVSWKSSLESNLLI